MGEDYTDDYVLENGVLRIPGSNKVTRGITNRPGFGSIYDRPVTDVSTLIIEDGVEEVGELAFANYVNLTKVVLPNTLKKIGGSCFDKCTSLIELTIPNSVDVIDYCAFQNCTSLRRVILPTHMDTLHGSVFFNDTALEYVDLPDGITVIENGTFQGCEALKKVNIPDGVKEIEDYAFAGTSINSLSLPLSLESVGEYVFPKSLEELHMWNSKTKFSFPCGLNDNVNLVGHGFQIPGKYRADKIGPAIIGLLIVLFTGLIVPAIPIALIALSGYKKKNDLPWGIFSKEFWDYYISDVFMKPLKERINIIY